MDIAGNLMWAIGQMWPDTKFLTTNMTALRFEIPDDAPRAELDPEDVPNARLHTDDAGKLWALDPDGMAVEPAEVLSRWAAGLARASLSNNPDAINYLEMRLVDPEGTIQVAVTILNPEGKAPYALHQEAVAEAEKLKLRVAELEAALWAAKGDAAILKDL
jgi:hypothetical protein